jgi:type II secretion system protein N
MNKIKTGYLYGSILLGAIILFLFFLFPGERVNQHVIQGIHGVLPDCDVVITGSAPALPMGLKLSGVSISRLDDEVFSAEKVKLGIPVLSLFSQNRRFSVKAKTYGGELKGVVTLIQNESTQEIQSVSSAFELTGIRIEEIPALDQLVSGGITGLLGGTVDIDSARPADQALINLHGTDVSFDLATSMINLGNMDFSDMVMDGVFTRNELTINGFDAKGSHADCRLSGKIHFSGPVEESTLHLSGVIHPHPEFLKKLQVGAFPIKPAGTGGLPFEISGTIENPVFLFR